MKVLKLVVMWPQFVEYHVDRLLGLKEHAPGIETVGMETAAVFKSGDPLPERSGRCETVDTLTLFPEREYVTLSPGEINASVQGALEQIDPDAVAVCGWVLPEARAAIAWCRRNDRAVVLMSASKHDDTSRNRIREAVKRRLIGLCDAALVGGSPQRLYMQHLGMPAENVFVGYDAIGNNYFQQAADAIKNGRREVDRAKLAIRNRPYFLASNRFIPRKNLDRLVIAYAKYRREIGDVDAWDLVLLGDGPKRGAIKQQIVDSQTDGVFLPGLRNIFELPAYYTLASCFVHPALQDQWGLVVNEAMACGLPVLVSQTAGCRYELVEEGANGWVFDPRDVDGIADLLARMHKLTAEQRDAMGRRSTEIISRWGPERFATELAKAVETAIRHSNLRRHRPSFIERFILQACI